MNANKCTYNNLVIHFHPKVYEPSEDTFLLLDTIEVNKNQKILEIGSGTGIIALRCAQIGADVICSDINPFSVELINKNIEINKNKLSGSIDVRSGDLFQPIKKEEQFDIIIFNPPYLPTTKNQLIGGDGWYDKALNGGVSGLDVTFKFLKQVKHFLTNNGRSYFVFSSLSKKTLLMQFLIKHALQSKSLKSMRFDDEILEVIMVTR